MKKNLYIFLFFLPFFLKSQQKQFILIDAQTKKEFVKKDSISAVKFLDSLAEKGKLIALDSPVNLCQRFGAYVVEWEGDTGREYNFFTTREKAAEFAGTLDTTTTIRHSNLEDVFVELTGRKVSG